MDTTTTDLRAHRASAYENSRPEIRRHVPDWARTVLDLGCASGAVGAALKADQDVEVVGLELDPVYAERAAARLDHVLQTDIERAEVEELPEQWREFDCLIAGDVLEHLRDPWTVLARFAGLLKPGGVAVISLPNVRYWETFWQLGIRGTWPRRTEGIFDRDHLRWFTAADGLALVGAAGLTDPRVHRTFRLRPRGSRLDRHLHLLQATPLRPFLTFQFAIVAQRPPHQTR